VYPVVAASPVSLASVHVKVPVRLTVSPELAEVYALVNVLYGLPELPFPVVSLPVELLMYRVAAEANVGTAMQNKQMKRETLVA
jgi:hypothetical protein